MFGRWAGNLMLQYAREAPFGPQGAFASTALGAPSLSVKQTNTHLYKLRDGCTSKQMGTFRHQVFGDPNEAIARDTLEQKWQAFKEKNREACTSGNKLRLACRVGDGPIHEVTTACHTKCGIYWAAGSYSTCTLMPTCKRCTGHSARWA